MVNKHLRADNQLSNEDYQPILLKPKLDNVFDLQRSICIQSAIINHNIDDSLLDKIERGEMKSLNSDVIEVILNIYPKPEDIVILIEAMAKLGVEDIESALTYLNYGKVEGFMLDLLVNRPTLKRKAEVIHAIQQVGPAYITLLERFQQWEFVKEGLLKSSFFKLVLRIIDEVKAINRRLDGRQPEIFNLNELPQLFKVKSVAK